MAPIVDFESRRVEEASAVKGPWNTEWWRIGFFVVFVALQVVYVYALWTR